MRKLALALVLAASSLASVAHAAGPRSFVKPQAGALKSYLQNTTGRLVKASTSPRSTYVKFNRALDQHPGDFRKIVLYRGVDTGATAYIPKVQVKGLKTNTAYVESFNIINHTQLRTVRLPLF